MSENVAGIMAGEIEVAVLGEIHRCRLIRGGGIVHDERVVRGERVRDLHGQRTRIPAVTRGTHVAQQGASMIARRDEFEVPQHRVEPVRSAMELVRSIVSGEHIGHAIEREAPVRDAIGVAADQRAHVGVIREIALERVIPQYDIARHRIAIGHGEGDDDAAVGEEAHRHAVRVAERDDIHDPPIGQYAERFARRAGHTGRDSVFRSGMRLFRDRCRLAAARRRRDDGEIAADETVSAMVWRHHKSNWGGWIRTTDLRINSPTLCQLSYAP